MIRLRSDYDSERLTVQTGGTLNSILLKERLIDRLLLIAAPILVGGVTTPSIVSGEAIHTANDLSQLTVLDLISCKKLASSFLQIEYNIRQTTEII